MDPHPEIVAKRTSRGKALLSSVLLIAGVLFVALLTANAWEKLRILLVSADWLLFILSTLIFVLGNWLGSFYLRGLLGKYGLDLTYFVAAQLYLYGQIAKYIPGKIWSIYYQALFLERPGAARAVIFSNIDLMVFAVVANAAFSSVLLFDVGLLPSSCIFLGGLLIGAGISNSSRLHDSVCAAMAFFRRPLQTRISPQGRVSVKLVALYYLTNWLVFIGANALMLYAVFGLPLDESRIYIAYLGFAWIAGLAIFFVPAGIGVRELIFVGLASGSGGEASLELLSSIAVVSRFSSVIQDISGAMLVFASAQLHKLYSTNARVAEER